jgi:tetratricopeptide (TPR) repeat protein
LTIAEQFSSALMALQRSQQILSHSLGQHDPLSLAIQEKIYQLYIEMENFESAEKVAFKLLDIFEGENAKSSTLPIEKRIQANQRIVQCWNSMGKTSEAIGFCGSAVSICRANSKWNDLVACVCEMGALHFKIGKTQQALSNFKQASEFLEKHKDSVSSTTKGT